MDEQIHRYEGRDVEVTWDARRCIHVGACVRGLPAVFEAKRRPWVLPDAASPDEVLDVVRSCPTGALHATRKDGGAPEPTPEANVVSVAADGPLYATGDLEVRDASGALVLADTRLALCRCGRSAHKPLCDGSHGEAGFSDLGTVTPVAANVADPASATGRVAITPAKDGPLLLVGSFDVEGTTGRLAFRDGRAALCRCGASGRKPLCDGTHKRVGFRAD